jgi:hypothetical protein
MPWAAGSYSKGNNGTGGWTGDASLGIGIEAGRHDTQDNDFATGINQCLNKDGSNAATGNLNLGGFIPTNLAAGTAAAPAICAGNDVNTGIFNPAADTWAVATNGSERMRVLSDGKVFIGRTSVIVGETLSSTGYAIIGDSTAGQGQLICGQGGAGEVIVGSYDNTPVLIRTNNVEKMRVDGTGSIGMGNNSVTTNRLSIYGKNSNSSSNSLACVNSSGTTTLYVRDDGAINTGAAANSPYNLTTGSAANVFVDSGGFLYRSTSSLKYKTEIQDYTHGLDAVNVLRPVFYKGKNDGDKKFAGLIAEEVHEAGLTEFVAYSEQDEPDALHYGNMVALAFKAIQELNAKVEALQARVDELEAA